MNDLPREDRSAVVLVVDRLGAGALGPYGNTWLDTPGTNLLASQSLLLEQMLVDTPDVRRLYRSYWQGLHALCPSPSDGDQPALPAVLQRAGIATTLLSDRRAIGEHPLAEGFAQRIPLRLRRAVRPTAHASRTALARMFASVVDLMARQRPPFLLWVDVGVLGRVWDAPLAFRRRFAEEDDPEPLGATRVPKLVLQEDYDPDQLHAITCAYAGQVAVLDLCLGTLLAALDEHAARAGMLLVLTSPRGFPLGEHQRVGAAARALHGELIHVPCLLRMPRPDAALVRSQALVQPPDLCATLAEWFAQPCPAPGGGARSLLTWLAADSPPPRALAVSVLGDEMGVRTPAWYLRCPAHESPAAQAAPSGADAAPDAALRDQLYVKPDDRWEVNEVSDRCPQVARQLRELGASFHQAAHHGRLDQLPPLPEDL